MRLRYLAIFALAAVTYFAYQYRDQLPERGAFIMSLRHQAQPPKIRLDTDPGAPSAAQLFALKVHADGPDDKPLIGMNVTAHCSLLGADHTGRDITLRDKGEGNYAATVSLDMPGKWEVEIVGTKEGWRTRDKFELEIGPPRHSAEDDDEPPPRFR
jgi:hypothetical protein